MAWLRLQPHTDGNELLRDPFSDNLGIEPSYGRGSGYHIPSRLFHPKLSTRDLLSINVEGLPGVDRDPDHDKKAKVSSQNLPHSSTRYYHSDTQRYAFSRIGRWQ